MRIAAVAAVAVAASTESAVAEARVLPGAELAAVAAVAGVVAAAASTALAVAGPVVGVPGLAGVVAAVEVEVAGGIAAGRRAEEAVAAAEGEQLAVHLAAHCCNSRPH